MAADPIIERVLFHLMISQNRCGYYNRAAPIRVRELIQRVRYLKFFFCCSLPYFYTYPGKPELFFFLNRFYKVAARAFVLLLCYFSFLQMLLPGSSGIRIIGHLQEENRFLLRHSYLNLRLSKKY